MDDLAVRTRPDRLGARPMRRCSRRRSSRFRTVRNSRTRRRRSRSRSITDQAFSQIIEGREDARRTVQAASSRPTRSPTHEEQSRTPPIAEAKKDVPTPPPPLKRIADPGAGRRAGAEPPKTRRPAAAAPPARATEAGRSRPRRPQAAKAETEAASRTGEPKDAEAVDAEAAAAARRSSRRPRRRRKPAPKPPEKPERTIADKLLRRCAAEARPRRARAIDRRRRPKSGEDDA